MTPNPSPQPSTLARIWRDLVAAGWHEAVLRYAAHGLLVAGLLLTIWASHWRLGGLDWIAERASLQSNGTLVPPVLSGAATPEPSTAGGMLLAALPPAGPATEPPPDTRVVRYADVHTLIPTRSRSTVLTYTVAAGDTLFGIAERYHLQPETVLWGNYFTLKDDPHLLRPGQVLNILPVDGAYHFVTEGNTLEQVAKFYGVQPADIVDWPGNNLDPAAAQLNPGAYLVIPGGQRELQVWTVPSLTRKDKATTANNFGQCPGGYSGAVGTGTFVWPADNHFLSGYDFSGIHRGIDIKAGLGAPIYATDSGVVVYAGPNAYGYGNLIVLDHGNGWQSVYAHLSQWTVVCGQSVGQGNLIGLSGNTGRSSGAHLHFELRYAGAYISPWTVLP